MNTNISQVHQLLIKDATGLDPIRVIMEPGPNHKDYTGHFTVVVYGRAWSTYWCSMNWPLAEFVQKAPTDYIVGRLTQSAEYTNKQKRKRDAEYLTRIVDAIRTALNEMDNPTSPATPGAAA